MANYTRKFPVQIEGQEEPFFVASATCGQTEEFLAEQKKAQAEETDLEAKEKRLEHNSYNFLVNCLNNVGGPERWTEASVKSQLDKLQIDAAMTIAQKQSGLVSPNLTTPATQA